MKYKTIVYGATLKGLGIACRNPKDTLILEPSGMVGHEFASALRFCKIAGQLPEEAFGADLYKELMNRNAVAQNIVYVPVIPAILMNLMKQYELNIAFSSVLISKQARMNEIAVTTLFHHQYVEYECEQFIDTTTDFAKMEQYDIPYFANIAALLYDAACDRQLHAPNLTRIADRPLYVLRLAVDAHQSFDTYRHLIMEHVRRLQQTHPGIKLLHIADTLDVAAHAKAQLIHEELGIYAPSCLSSNLFDAIAEGMLIGGM